MAGGSDAVATFGMDLESNMPDVAGNSARALEDLKDKIQGDTNSLREMQKALRNLQGGTAINIASFKDLKEKIAAQKATIANSTQSYLSLGGSFKDTAKKGSETAKGFGALTEAAKGAPGPLGSFGGKLGEIAELFEGGALASGGLLVAAAIVAVAAAAIYATGALLKFGIGVADARRSELLHLEALTKLRYGYLGLAGGFQPAADKASFLQSTIDAVSSSVAISRDQVAGYAEDLYRTGLRGGNLQAALQGVAITAATQGEAAAGAFKNMALSAGLTGHSVRALADDVKARLGGIAAAQLLSLDVQSRKLHESFGMLFSGLKIDKLLEGVSKITELFSQSSASGRALKALIEGLFGPLIDQVSGPASLLVKRFFQGMVIAALYLGITILKVRNWFRSTFGDTSILKNVDMMRVAVYAGAIAVGLLAASIGLVALSLVPFAALVAISVGSVIALGYGIYKGIAALGNLAVAAKDVAVNIIHGLVDGIKSGAAWVVSAIENVANGAVKAFKNKLGIASPSKIFMRAAIEVPHGMAGGINAGRPAVHRAVQSLVSIPNQQAESRRTGRNLFSMPIDEHGEPRRQPGEFDVHADVFGGSARPSPRAEAPRSITFGDINIHGAKTDEPEDFAERFKAEAIKLFQGGLTELGAPVP